MLANSNPMNKVMVVLLFFQAITCGLAIAVLVQVAQASVATSSLVGGGATLLCLLAATLLRRGVIGWTLGWASQVATIALGVFTPAMFVMGAIFCFLWVVCFVLGRRLGAQGVANR